MCCREVRVRISFLSPEMGDTLSRLSSTAKHESYCRYACIDTCMFVFMPRMGVVVFTVLVMHDFMPSCLHFACLYDGYHVTNMTEII
jgi:hypothetical protein